MVTFPQKKTPKNQVRTGAVAVEFAIVFPIILILFFGILTLVRLVLLRDAAQHAAYEGARSGMVFDATTESCENRVHEFLEVFGIKNAVVTITPEEISLQSNTVTVKVDIPFSDNSWGATDLLPADWTTSQSITLTREAALLDR